MPIPRISEQWAMARLFSQSFLNDGAWPATTRLCACHACTQVYTQVYTQLYTHVYVHVYTHVCVHVYIHVYTHVYTQVKGISSASDQALRRSAIGIIITSLCTSVYSRYLQQRLPICTLLSTIVMINQCLLRKTIGDRRSRATLPHAKEPPLERSIMRPWNIRLRARGTFD